MKLHSVIVSYERPELLERTVRSYVATCTLDYYLVVVDNHSGEDTQRLIRDLFQDGYIDMVVNLPENKYPGYATNQGWAHAHTATALYHRSDNDVQYLPGWCDEVVERFKTENLWQLGLRTLEEEGNHANVGGNCVITREAYMAGIRYSGEPWTERPFEDALMSHKIHRAGKWVGRVQRPCIEHIGLASSTDPYYQETFRVRGITFEQWGVK